MEPTVYRPVAPPSPLPVCFQFSIAPTVTVTNRVTESIAAVIAGVVLGFVAALLMAKDEDQPRR